MQRLEPIKFPYAAFIRRDWKPLLCRVRNFRRDSCESSGKRGGYG